MSDLQEYRRKRDFSKTTEPGVRKQGKRARGQSSESSEPIFVVQKHAARHLHYDFRLELDGVLLSWAVPKGPSLDPATKRLAMQTEDHPLAYADFEGVIPKGQYGAGTVLVWDRGVWKCEGNAREAYERGHLKFALSGEKLKGKWHLVRRGGSRSWLLFKSRDQYAESGPAGSKLVDDAPNSVISGRGLDSVARNEKAVPARKSAESAAQPSSLTGARKAKLPASLMPELATLVSEVPEGDAWLHEMKFDGYRILVRLEGKRVRCFTRKGNDWTSRMPTLAAALAELPLDRALLDGELCVLKSDGTSDFQRLQNSLNAGTEHELVYFAFDLVHWDGWDLTRVPLIERKRALEALLNRAGDPRIRFSAHIVGQGRAFFTQACERGLEGIVSKRADSRYTSKRGRDWLKVKCVRRHELVIGGFTEPGGSRSHLGALLVGAHDDEGRLVYRGKVGTGFTHKTLLDLHGRLKPLERKQAAFHNPPSGAAARGVHWVAPKLLAEIEYTEVTSEGLLRHPRFKGLRSDKKPSRITMEVPVPSPQRSVELPIALTNPDRVLYPEQGLTKRALAEYYVEVAEHMLPHVKDRVLMLVRCPEGRAKECFHQKHMNKGMPKQFTTVPIREQGKLVHCISLSDVSGLVALAQIGALEVHSWGAHADRPERPDQLVFDLDPGPGVEWSGVVASARQVKHDLEELGLQSFVKTTGGKGLHVVVPIQRRIDWDTAKSFCKAVAERACRAAPDKYVCNMSKAKRNGRIFIDYLRNGRGATSVCAYSPRARIGAPVSTPLAWHELEREVRADYYTVQNLRERLTKLSEDPWHGMADVRQSVTKAMLRSLRLA